MTNTMNAIAIKSLMRELEQLEAQAQSCSTTNASDAILAKRISVTRNLLTRYRIKDSCPSLHGE